MLTDTPLLDVEPSHGIFTAIVGSHAYGLNNDDSDFDYRGCHYEPTRDFWNLAPKPDERFEVSGGTVDYVSYEIEKFLKLLVNSNANMMEALYSPHMLTIRDPIYLGRIQAVFHGCSTMGHAKHYLAMSRSFMRKYDTHGSLKYLLNAFRALFTGLYLAHTGVVELNLSILSKIFYPNLEYLIPDIKQQDKFYLLTSKDTGVFDTRTLELESMLPDLIPAVPQRTWNQANWILRDIRQNALVRDST